MLIFDVSTLEVTYEVQFVYVEKGEGDSGLSSHNSDLNITSLMSIALSERMGDDNLHSKITKFFNPSVVKIEGFALNEDQVRDLDLAHNPTRKTRISGPLHKAFRKRFPQFGDNCYELEAFPHQQLISLMIISEVPKYYDPQKVDMERIREWERRYDEEKSALLQTIKGVKKPPVPHPVPQVQPMIRKRKRRSTSWSSLLKYRFVEVSLSAIFSLFSYHRKPLDMVLIH